MDFFKINSNWIFDSKEIIKNIGGNFESNQPKKIILYWIKKNYNNKKYDVSRKVLKDFI
jgi:hypothetical protein